MACTYSVLLSFLLAWWSPKGETLLLLLIFISAVSSCLLYKSHVLLFSQLSNWIPPSAQSCLFFSVVAPFLPGFWSLFSFYSIASPFSPSLLLGFYCLHLHGLLSTLTLGGFSRSYPSPVAIPLSAVSTSHLLLTFVLSAFQRTNMACTYSVFLSFRLAWWSPKGETLLLLLIFLFAVFLLSILRKSCPPIQSIVKFDSS